LDNIDVIGGYRREKNDPSENRLIKKNQQWNRITFSRIFSKKRK